MDISRAMIHDRQYQRKRYIGAIGWRMETLGPGCQNEEATLCPVGAKKSAHILLSVALVWFGLLKVIVIALMPIISRIANINSKEK